MHLKQDRVRRFRRHDGIGDRALAILMRSLMCSLTRWFGCFVRLRIGSAFQVNLHHQFLESFWLVNCDWNYPSEAEFGVLPFDALRSHATGSNAEAISSCSAFGMPNCVASRLHDATASLAAAIISSASIFDRP
jgi:hypothetical protein